MFPIVLSPKYLQSENWLLQIIISTHVSSGPITKGFFFLFPLEATADAIHAK